MTVSSAVKQAYLGGDHKNLFLYFPDLQLTIGHEDIVSESMSLHESIFETESIEFVGCNASQFKIQVRNLHEDIKGQFIVVSITTDSTTSSPIPLFCGIVDGVDMSAKRNYKTITAYDELYSKGQIDVAGWYKALTFPISIGNFRDRLFDYVGLEQVSTALPNDSIMIEKQYSPNELQAITVIKSLCQINGVFGIINRNGDFEYVTILPSDTPPTETMDAYRDITFQEFVVQPVEKLVIRESSDDEGVSYGSGTNRYVIQGNFFAKGLEEETLLDMAENIYPNIEGFSYAPFNASSDGLPWVECGKDIIKYRIVDFENSTSGSIVYKYKNFYVLNRILTGIQVLTDEYSALGDEYQHEFITDIQVRVDTIVEQISEIIGRLEDYSLNYVVFTNPQKIIINDGDEVNTWRTSFAVQKPTQVMVNIEILFDCETTVSSGQYYDLELEVHYYFDRVLIDTRKPIETYVDGKHILKLFYILNIQRSDIQHLFEVNLIANGGKATIEIGQGLYTLCGQKLVGDVWDGTFDFRQVIPIIELQHPTHALTIRGIVDTATVATQTPVGAEIDQEIPVIVFGHPTHAITINGISETLTVATNEV